MILEIEWEFLDHKLTTHAAGSQKGDEICLFEHSIFWNVRNRNVVLAAQKIEYIPIFEKDGFWHPTDSATNFGEPSRTKRF